MKKLLTIFYLLNILSCTTSINEDVDFDLYISRMNVPQNLNTSYELTDTKLVVKNSSRYSFIGEKDPKKEVVFEYNLKDADKIFILNQARKLDLLRLDSIYYNHCITDGLELHIAVVDNGVEYNTDVYNFYDPQVSKLVGIMNEVLPKDYQIWYNKESLEERMKDCE